MVIKISKDYMEELVEEITSKELSKEDIAKLKIKLCKKYGLKSIPTDITLLLSVPNEQQKVLKKYLQSKPGRTLSGVSPIAVMTSPHACPHGKCTTCPGGVDSFFGDVPQSYTGNEPASMRAIRANYDAYTQVFNRLEQYIVMGHLPDKSELIIMGGTFPARTKEYQETFVTYCLKAMNDFSEQFFEKNELKLEEFKQFFELPADVNDVERGKRLQGKILELRNNFKPSLEQEQEKNETTKIRCVGMTIETRPDYALLIHGNEMLRLGATRVELGIQSVYDFALEGIKRGHSVKDNIIAIKTLRNLGFKLNFHMMLGLPGVTKEKDLEGLKQIFEDSNYMPDMIKLYPCMVMPGTELEKQYEEKKYVPLTTEESAEMISELKRTVPKYCRIMRVQRDIPTNKTIAGVDKTNLRQYIDIKLREKNITCNCIRCREIGRKKKFENPELTVKEYAASEGKEYFISIEDKKNNSLAGFCRLRIPGETLREEITKDSAIIRELHVYGSAVPIGESGNKTQHKGYGKQLMQKAEELAKKEGKTKLLVISGIGVREYYEKIGYARDGPYMVKSL